MQTEKEQKLYQDRLKALETLQSKGFDPYPATTKRTHRVEEVLGMFGKSGFEKKKAVVAGRLVAKRGHGNLIFANLRDESGTIQLVFKADELGKEKVKLLDNFHTGDFAEASGNLYKTKTGEKSILVKDFRMLAKSLRALPEKFHGLKDTETRLRKRYLDFLANPDVRELFVMKSKFWHSVREFLNKENFLEVETPVLESVPGGAEAEPFVTKYNALDRDFFLRISLELPLKRLLVGGFEKVYEIGRIFRNEGISSEHLQDYTQMEFYWAYSDYNELKKLLQKMYRHIIKELFGKLKVTSRGKELDWGAKWEEYDYYKLFKKHAGLDLNTATVESLKKKADELNIKYEKFAQKGRLIDLIFKKTVRPVLIKPGFLVNPPVEIEPLAKRMEKEEGRVQRVQVVAWGTELGKGFSELNDPIDQRKRFEDQMKLREQGDKEAQQLDEDFVEALEYGMPPAAGFGMSERFFSVLMDVPIRETVIFPPMKAEADEG